MKNFKKKKKWYENKETEKEVRQILLPSVEAEMSYMEKPGSAKHDLCFLGFTSCHSLSRMFSPSQFIFTQYSKSLGLFQIIPYDTSGLKRARLAVECAGALLESPLAPLASPLPIYLPSW